MVPRYDRGSSRYYADICIDPSGISQESKLNLHLQLTPTHSCLPEFSLHISPLPKPPKSEVDEYVTTGLFCCF